jgi:hypothetical protein
MCDRIGGILISVHRPEDEILIIQNPHSGFHGIGVGRVKGANPAQGLFRPAPQLSLDQRENSLLPACLKLWIHRCQSACVFISPDFDQYIEFFESHFVKQRHKINLVIIGMLKEKFLLAWEIQQEMGVPTSLQNQSVQLFHQWYSSSAGSNSHAVSFLDMCGMVNQDLGELLQACV